MSEGHDDALNQSIPDVIILIQFDWHMPNADLLYK